MSANLDLVRSIYADWRRCDFSSTEWADPGIEYLVVDGPEPGSVKGLAAMVERFRDFLTAWQHAHPEVDGYRELDEKRVLVLTHRVGRGKTSGLEVGETRTQGANVFHVRDGKVTKLVWYWDRDRALADLGLEG